MKAGSACSLVAVSARAVTAVLLGFAWATGWAAPDDAPALESAAVAARFVDPPVVYRTPAFEPGHAGFTSNAELHAFIASLEASAALRAGGSHVRVIGLGTSQAGAPIEALLFAHGVAGAGISPGEVVEGQRPTVLLIGQQHGDEPASAEALMVVAEALAHGRLERLLDRINVVVLPRANPDGAALDRRTTASGIDMNRDHLWLDTPEAQAVAQLVREFAPIVVVDAHEYDARADPADATAPVPRFDALLQYATTANLAPFVTKAADEWIRKPLVATLRAESLSSEWYHTSAPDRSDAAGLAGQGTAAAYGAAMGRIAPDNARNVIGLRNAVGLLLETRGGGLGKRHLARRVFTQVTAFTSVLESAAARADAFVKLRHFVDLDVSALACRGDVTVEARMTTSEHTWTMLDPSTGADVSVTAPWDSALALQSLKSRPRPCGYWLAADESDAAARLRALGVRVEQVDEGGDVRGEAYRETAREIASDAASGAASDAASGVTNGVTSGDDVANTAASVASAGAGGDVRVRVQTVPSLLDVASGGYYVPLDQPFANLAVAALEPDTAFSFFAHRIVGRLDHEARLLARPRLRTSPMP